jgi:hypothetical protein
MLRRRFRRAGIMTPDQVFGLAWSGAMTADRLAALIRRLPQGVSEIYLHPAVIEDYPGATPGYRHQLEFEALFDKGVAAALRSAGDIRLGGFADFFQHR